MTAGGTTSWHDIAIHIISRHCSPGEALRIAKVYLLKWHGEGQLPYTTRVRRTPHADSVVRCCEQWLTEHCQDGDAIKQVVELANIPERTLKRRSDCWNPGRCPLMKSALNPVTTTRLSSAGCSSAARVSHPANTVACSSRCPAPRLQPEIAAFR